MRFIYSIIVLVFLSVSTIFANDNNIKWYGKNDSINYLIGFGRIHFINGDTLSTKFYSDVYKDLILVKNKKKIEVFTPMDINYVVVDSYHDTTNLLIAPLKMNGLDNGFYELKILGDAGLVTKSIIYDYANNNGFLEYSLYYMFYVIVEDRAYEIKSGWKIKKDIITLLPRHQDRLMEIYDSMNYKKIDKRLDYGSKEKIEAVKYLFEEYNKLENPEYINKVKEITKDYKY